MSLSCGALATAQISTSPAVFFAGEARRRFRGGFTVQSCASFLRECLCFVGFWLGPAYNRGMDGGPDKYTQAVDRLIRLADWAESLLPGLWVPPAAIQSCLPWTKSYLRELVEDGRVAERTFPLGDKVICRMASVHDALAIVERSAGRAARLAARREALRAVDEVVAAQFAASFDSSRAGSPRNS